MRKLYEQLKQYGESDVYPYHMPGHKRHAWGQLPEEIARIDITEIDGFDNLHQAEGILQELQERAAVLYGAEESFYLINGSSCGILSAVSAALPQGGHLLMARNCHKSAYHAAYLRNLTISYLYPWLIEEYDICEAITPGQVKEALEREPDIGAVLVVSPTYEGRIADVRAIAEIVHERGIPLIVDEAHGAHLGLVRGQKPNSCQQGADIVIHSVHKTLPAMTQTALLHVNGNRINRDKLRRFLHIYQSSSPSYVLMASIDNALQVVAEQGEELFETQRRSFADMLDKLKACRYFRFLPLDEKQDIGKLIISSQKTGLSGQQIYDMLLQEYHLQLEMAAGSYCLAMFTAGDTQAAYVRMTQALLALDEAIAEGRVEGAGIAGADIKNAEGAAVEGTKSAAVKGTKSAAVEDTKSAAVEGTKSAAVEGTKSADVEDTKSAAVEDTKSADVEGTKSAAVKGTKSADVEGTKSAAVKGTEGTDIKRTKSVCSEAAEQTGQEQVCKETDAAEQKRARDENIAGIVRCKGTRENRFGNNQDIYFAEVPLAQAWDMEYELVPLKEAVGRCAGDFINLYPPGVPLLVPGEVLHEEQASQLEQYLQQGLNVQGVGAEPPHLVKVLKQAANLDDR